MKEMERARELYRRHLRDEITAGEYEELLGLMKDSKLQEIFEKEMKFVWETSIAGKSPVEWDEIDIGMKRQSIKKATISTSKVRWMMAMAASVALLVSIYLIGILNTKSHEVFVTKAGEVRELILDDGTKVKLNANSELKWSIDWRKKQERVVELKGEAFFSVSKRSMRAEGLKLSVPFMVSTADLTVRVLGTSFNVKRRRNNTDVYLEEGRVKLALNSKLLRNEIVMAPGELMSFSSKTDEFYRNQSPYPDEESWMDGSLKFTKQPVYKILESLEEIYDVEFLVEDEELLSRQISIGIPYENWVVVQEALQLILNVEFDESEGKLTLKK